MAGPSEKWLPTIDFKCPQVESALSDLEKKLDEKLGQIPVRMGHFWEQMTKQQKNTKIMQEIERAKASNMTFSEGLVNAWNLQIIDRQKLNEFSISGHFSILHIYVCLLQASGGVISKPVVTELEPVTLLQRFCLRSAHSGRGY